MHAKPGNFAALRIHHRISEAKTADPDPKPSVVQDMMIGEIRKHYHALLEKRGVSLPLSSAIIEDVSMAPSLAAAEIDEDTGEILDPGLAEVGQGGATNLLATAETSPPATAPTSADLEPELGFMAELSDMLANNSTQLEESSNEH